MKLCHSVLTAECQNCKPNLFGQAVLWRSQKKWARSRWSLTGDEWSWQGILSKAKVLFMVLSNALVAHCSWTGRQTLGVPKKSYEKLMLVSKKTKKSSWKERCTKMLRCPFCSDHLACEVTLLLWIFLRQTLKYGETSVTRIISSIKFCDITAV